MTAIDGFFYFNGAIALLSAAFAMTQRNAVHALLYIVLSALSLSLAFYLLNAPIAAALEVMVYAGAIMVLFVFVVMLLNVFKKAPHKDSSGFFMAVILPVTFALLLFGEIVAIISMSEIKSTSAKMLSVKDIAVALFGEYGIVVELASLILMAGLVGAYHVGKKISGVK